MKNWMNKVCIFVFKWYSKLMMKGTIEMSKKQETTEEIVVLPVPAQQAPLTRFMIGTYIDPVNGQWMLSFVKFNPATGDIGKVQTERVAGNFEVMQERLMIKQMELGLYQAEPVIDNAILVEKLY